MKLWGGEEVLELIGLTINFLTHKVKKSESTNFSVMPESFQPFGL